MRVSITTPRTTTFICAVCDHREAKPTPKVAS
jgi:hypothetical protein